MSSLESQPEGLISADSHVFEPVEAWEGVLPADFWPDGGAAFAEKPAGRDPEVRLVDMARDGLSAEVLYPSLGLPLFGLDDPATQEAAFVAYNDWLAAFCKPAPEKLIGVGLIACYDIDNAVAELERCKANGMKGFMVWQSPHPDLPFSSDHYDPLWAAAERLDMPLSLHILTGFNYSRVAWDEQSTLDKYRGAINLKLAAAADALFDLTFAGALTRFPGLQLVLVENEIGWMPFLIDQWDYYWNRFKDVAPLPLTQAPSETVRQQIRATFFRDPMAGRLFEWWEPRIGMWSSDYPHGNTTWPESRSHVERNLGRLDPAVRRRLVWDNVVELYSLDVEGLEVP